ncbi:TIGR00266 family protein [Niveibacterium sp. 24ML]|uniref:TIGR00266 family protein n=1 Tax=Niveibacterium sp. 24ML TaxID=2985512 RepID=UPI00227216EA|nr:TIGR00266 family protein [Niveibacterium sp. 24ML]MCX9155974.1 TIGR00266 family protein [Niveibacterium sp. 24ML]
MTYKVSVTGYATPNAAAAQAAFAQAFKITPEKAAELLTTLPRTIKVGLDADTAERYCQALAKMGLNAEHSHHDAPAAKAAPSASATVTSAAVPAAKPAAAAPEAAPPPQPRAAAEQPGFQFRIDGAPDFAFLTVQLPANHSIKVEAAAMATMDTSIRMKTKLSGGLGRLVTGESIFVNEFSADTVAGEIGIAPGAPGDLAHVYLKGGEVLFLQNGAFVACDPDVTLETKWQGFTKGFFSGESFFLIRASGTGDLWFNTYGGMIEKEVDGEYVVDTGNIVAFTEGLDYKLEKFGGYKSLFFSGEGFVCRFRGKGRVWVQTRTSGALLAWAEQYRRVGKEA